MSDAPAGADFLSTSTLPAEPATASGDNKPRRWRLRLRRWWLVPLATLPLVAVGWRQLAPPAEPRPWRRRCRWRWWPSPPSRLTP